MQTKFHSKIKKSFFPEAKKMVKRNIPFGFSLPPRIFSVVFLVIPEFQHSKISNKLYLLIIVFFDIQFLSLACLCFEGNNYCWNILSTTCFQSTEWFFFKKSPLPSLFSKKCCAKPTIFLPKIVYNLLE